MDLTDWISWKHGTNVAAKTFGLTRFFPSEYNQFNRAEKSIYTFLISLCFSLLFDFFVDICGLIGQLIAEIDRTLGQREACNKSSLSSGR